MMKTLGCGCPSAYSSSRLNFSSIRTGSHYSYSEVVSMPPLPRSATTTCQSKAVECISNLDNFPFPHPGFQPWVQSGRLYYRFSGFGEEKRNETQRGQKCIPSTPEACDGDGECYHHKYCQVRPNNIVYFTPHHHRDFSCSTFPG